jgi:hypothetical protein
MLPNTARKGERVCATVGRGQCHLSLVMLGRQRTSRKLQSDKIRSRSIQSTLYRVYAVDERRNKLPAIK